MELTKQNADLEIAAFTARKKVLEEKELEQREAVKLLSHCLLEFQNTTKFLAAFATKGMNEVYDSSFVVEFPFTLDANNNPTGLDYVVTKDTVQLQDPKEDLGDGEFSTLVMLIFLGCFIKSTKEDNRILFLDEPTPALDKEAWKALGKLLQKICEEFKCQINMTTHVSEPIGKTFLMDSGKVKEIFDDN